MADERADVRKWMEIADQRAIEVATLKVENERLRAALQRIAKDDDPAGKIARAALST